MRLPTIIFKMFDVVGVDVVVCVTPDLGISVVRSLIIKYMSCQNPCLSNSPETPGLATSLQWLYQ